jgi:hypothetical protein
MMRIGGVIAACLLAACSGRLGGGQADDDDDGTTSTSTSTSTSSTSTSTTDTGTSTVSTTDDPDTDDGILWDVQTIPDHGMLPPGPCGPFELGTDVSGDPPLGAFAGNRAWMGGYEVYPRIVILENSADSVAEEEHAADNNGELLDGPALIIAPEVPLDFPQTFPIEVEHFVAGNSEWFMAELTVDYYQMGEYSLQPEYFEGSIALWPDQNADGVEGTIVADFCDRYTRVIWGE